MRNEHDNTEPKSGFEFQPKHVIGLGIAVCMILPLIVSSQQAGGFFKSLGPTGNSTLMLLTAWAIIFSSPTLALMLSQADNKNHRSFAVVVMCMISVFSIITSTVAIHNKIQDNINTQTNSSATSTSIQSAIESNQKTIAGLQEQIDALDPVYWRGQRAKFSRQIQDLQAQNIELMDRQDAHAASGQGSSTKSSFDHFARYGITPFGLALFAAILLDMIVLCAGLMIGGIIAKQSGQGSLKKH